MTPRARVLLLALAAAVPLAGCASPPPPRTLRALYGIEPARSFVADQTALVLVDFQREFLDGALRDVEGAHDAVLRAAALRAWARGHGILVVHVRNVAARADSPVFAASSPNTAFVAELTPDAGEVVVEKRQAGAFSRTELHALLAARGIGTIVVAGIMTHLAVDTTARDGGVLGYRVVVAADACATRPLPSPLDARVVPARDVHRIALTSLADRFADVRSVDQVLALPVAPHVTAAWARRTW